MRLAWAHAWADRPIDAPPRRTRCNCIWRVTRTTPAPHSNLHSELQVDIRLHILSDLQLHGIDELGFIHLTRADTVLLSLEAQMSTD